MGARITGGPGRTIRGAGGSSPKAKAMVEIFGVERVKRVLEKFGVDAATGLSKAIKLGALMVQGDARRSIISSPKNGITYHDKNKSPKVHRASTSPNPPANWEGNLARGIVVRTDSDGLTADVVSTARSEEGHDYGATLEFGSQDGKIKKRPFMRPAFTKNKPAISKAIKLALSKAKPKGI